MSLSQTKTQELLSKNPHNKYHQQHALVKGQTLARKVKNMIWNQLPKHSLTVPANYRVQHVSQKGVIKSTFGQSNMPEFEIPNEQLELAEAFDFAVTLANGNADNAWVSTLNPFYWLRRTELWQGGKLIQTILPEDIRDTYIFENNDLRDRQINASLYGVNSGTYASSVSIAAASSSTYYIRIPNVLKGLYLENLEGLKFKFVFEDIANVSSSSYNGDITVTDIKLYITDIQVDEATKTQLRADNLAGHDKRVLIATNEENIVSLGTSATRYKIVGFNNSPYVAFATVEVTDRSSHQYTRETRKALTSLAFEGQGNVAVDGITWTDSLNRLFLAPKTFEDEGFFVNATYPYMYILPGACLDGRKALVDGIHTGGTVWQDNMQLNLIAPSSYSNHTLLLRVHCYAHVRIQGGKITVY